MDIHKILRPLYILIFCLAPVIAAAINGLRNLEPSAPQFQCELRELFANERAEQFCSGTYINSSVFVTAAHCFNPIDAGPLNSESRVLEVRCPQKSWRVRAVAPHPFYFQSLSFKKKSLVDYGSVGRIDRLTSIGTYDTNDYYDIAVVLTDENDLLSFANLPSLYPSFAPGSCRMLGYSPHICQKDGTACYRTSLSLHVPTRNTLLSTPLMDCNLATEDDCFHFDVNSRERGPFYLELTGAGGQVITETSTVAAKGDSGGGILCQDMNQSEVVAGVFTNGRSGPNSINVARHLKFISSFTSLAREEFTHLSQTVEIAPDVRALLTLIRSVGRLANESINTQVSDKIFISGAESHFVSAFQNLESWLKQDPKDRSALLSRNKIKFIQAMSAIDKKNVQIIDSFLMFSEKASVIDFERAFK